LLRKERSAPSLRSNLLTGCSSDHTFERLSDTFVRGIGIIGRDWFPRHPCGRVCGRDRSEFVVADHDPTDSGACFLKIHSNSRTVELEKSRADSLGENSNRA
jgi:hypothetical protein